MTSLRAFREVVEAGSFSAAAERLSISAPMASKHVSELEQSLGARLLHRSSRHLSLTEAGEAYYAQCRQALETLEAAESAIGEHSTVPRGELKVTAPVWCANKHFAQVLASYRQRCPEVVVDMRLENRTLDLVTDGFDLALRATVEPSLTLISRPLCRVPGVLVASPAYLAQISAQPDGQPGETPGAILPSYVSIDKLPTLTDTDGKRAMISRAVMRSDDETLMRHAALAGIGMAFLPEWLIAEDLAQGDLVAAPDQPVAPRIMLFAVYMSRRFMPLKLRTFIDHLAEVFDPDGTTADFRTPHVPEKKPTRIDIESLGTPAS